MATGEQIENAILAAAPRDAAIAHLAGQNGAQATLLRRGVQGKWKDTTDSMGKQYDPAATAQTNYTMSTEANTVLNVVNVVGGYETWRTDTTNMTEDKNEYIKINGL